MGSKVLARSSIQKVRCLITQASKLELPYATSVKRGLFTITYEVRNIFERTLQNYTLSIRDLHKSFPESKGEGAAETASVPIAKLERKMLLSFKCKICETRITKLISKVSYEKGVVIVRCHTCNNNHLIADNLNWFTDLNGMRNVEEILAAKGESVQRLMTTDCLELINTETEGT